MAGNHEFDREVRYEIVEYIGVISEHSTGWKKELNLVSWNGGAPKYDIRDWDPNHNRMSRGVTLHENEMRHIFELMKKRRQKHYHHRNEAAMESLAAANAAEGEAAERPQTMETVEIPIQETTDDFCNRREEAEVMESIAEMKEVS